MNQHKVNGVISEFLAAAWFTRNGYIVSWPSDSSVEYDFIIDNKTDEPKRVQVKTIYFENSKKRYIGSLVLTHRQNNGKSLNKKYKQGAFDIAAFVSVETNSIYIVPFDFVHGRRSITFYPDEKGNANYKRPFNFESFKEVLINNDE